MKYKKIAAFAAALTVTLSAAGCGSSSDSSSSSKSETTTAAETTDEATTNESTTAEAETTEPASAVTASSLSAEKRKVRDTETPMGEEGTWTVFVYLCGSDLESGNNAASIDISEMAKASENENIKCIVLTGGSTKWALDIDPKASERYIIKDGDAKKLSSNPDTNMGDSTSLSDFIKWGVSEYPAAHMGVILWDHGSGSINGVCYDENHNDDHLLLRELDAALYNVYDDMTDRFEFIGFDACLMGTAETAAMMATHARYMIASEETEPGCGWNYTAIGNYLAENPKCSGAELGKEICDSFYQHCSDIGREAGITLSVMDLSNMDNFISAFDKYSKELCETAEDSAAFSKIVKNINAADNFGGNKANVGFTNMVDMGGFINAGMDKCPSASEALSALNDTVLYKIKGKDHSEASGMSMYYPLQIKNSSELGVFSDVCISPYYLGLVDKIAHGYANNGDISGYDNSDFIQSLDLSYKPDNYTSTDGNYVYTPNDGSKWSYLEGGMEECTFKFDTAPTVDPETNTYWFDLADEELERTAYVEATLFLYNEETQSVLMLGTTGEVSGDPETGKFVDGFDGSWFSLPDGQYLPAYLYEKCDGYDLYCSPILLNGEQTFMRFAYVNTDEGAKVAIIDHWSGVDENGSVARSGDEFKAGDVITPLYTLLSVEDGNDDATFAGNEYVYTDDTEISFGMLNNGTYLYSFIINDIFGSYYTADPIMISFIEGQVVYSIPED